MLNKIIRLLFPKMPKGFSKGIHASVILLSLFGILMVVSANVGVDASSSDLVKLALKELVFLFVSYIIMVRVARSFNRKFITKNIQWLVIGSLIFLIAPLFFRSVKGANAWIILGPITIQPAEFIKVSMMLVFATYLADRPNIQGKPLKDYIKIPFVFLLLSLFIVVILQRDLGSGAVLLLMTFFIFMIPSNPTLSNVQLGLVVAFSLGFAFVMFLSTPTGVEVLQKAGLNNYMFGRFSTVANPLGDTSKDSHHVYMGFIGLVRGGLTGVGLGQGIIKRGYLKEGDTDFILANIVEELGMIGLAFILLFYGIITFTLIRNANRSRTEYTRMILLGVASYLVVHFLFNVGGLTALIPLTGVPLLMISAGSSSRLAFMIALGIAQSLIAKERRELE